MLHGVSRLKMFSRPLTKHMDVPRASSVQRVGRVNGLQHVSSFAPDQIGLVVSVAVSVSVAGRASERLLRVRVDSHERIQALRTRGGRRERDLPFERDGSEMVGST